jgi:hypothetical protein
LKNRIFISLLVVFSFASKDFFAQEKDKTLDTSSIISFRLKKVWYSDFGFNTAPFSINFKDANGNKEHLFYRNNLRSVLGIGFSYKWIAIRLALNLPGHVKPVSKFGKTKYIDLGFEFKTKKRFFDIDYHDYVGYAIKNAYKWNDSLNQFSNPHFISNKLQAQSLSVNVWRFYNKKIILNALRGKTAIYKSKEQSFYIKTTFNAHGLINDTSLIPFEKTVLSNTKTSSKYIFANDFGLIPGYVYVNRYKNWQYSAMFGFGPVLQIKNYGGFEFSRTFVGLAPRIDIRINLGYNVNNWFVNLVTEFDNKSIRFNDLAYRQTFYMIKLVGGIRL